MKWMKLPFLLLWWNTITASAVSPTTTTTNNNNKSSSFKNTEQWISLSPQLEFHPATSNHKMNLDEITKRHLLNGFSSTSGYETQFIDGSESYYNDYAQAWRLLGFYTDCNAPHNNYNECNNNNNNQNHNNDHDNQDYSNTAACQRYLLWAAYIDLDYSGGGIGEYQYYDRQAGTWDASSCRKNTVNKRCVKMDCHLQDTHFKLLGFFKEPNYHEWMEQLFKHQGVCLWTDTEYYFMQQDRYLWPCSCTSTGQYDEHDNLLYYDTKPMPEGRIGLGLYTDNRCKYDYTGTKLDLTTVLQNVRSEGNNDNQYGSILDLEQSLSQWNDAFDVYKICQPCKAYDLGYIPDEDFNERQGQDDDTGYAFDCIDDADYINVNQCMKFKTKTEMLAADFRDIMLAHQQGNIVEFEVMGQTYGYGGYRNTAQLQTTFDMAGGANIPVKKSTLIWMVCSWFVLGAGLVSFWMARRNARELAHRMGIPLIGSAASTSTDSKNGVLS